MIGYILGLLAVAGSSELSWLHPLIGVVLVLLARRVTRLKRALLGLGCALIYASIWGEYQLAHRLAQDLGKVDLDLQGEVASIVNLEEGRQRFLFKLSSNHPDFPRIRRVRLTLYSAEPQLKQGDKLTLEARVQTPQTYMNAHSPDARRRALQQRVDATGYVRTLYTQSSNPTLRQNLFDYLTHEFEPKISGFLSALVLGEARGLSSAQWQLLRETGTVHLAVVSGLHMGVLAVSGVILGRVLVFILATLTPALARRFVATPWLLALLLVSLYLNFGGTGLPLQRAWVLVSLLLVGQLFKRSPPIRERFNLALVLVTLLDPLAVLELGFWLSFGLVWILMQVACWRGLGGRLSQVVRVQLILSLLLMPVLLLALAQLNLLSVITNLWAIPWVSLGVMALPLVLPLMQLTPLAEWLVTGWIELFWLGLTLSAKLGLHGAWLPPPLWAMPLAFTAVILLLAPFRLVWVGLALLLPLLLYRPAQTQGFNIRILDVGQGQAAIIDLPGERWVYDTGPAFGSGFAIAELTLLPTLRRRPDLELTGLIVSHGDRDHAGGVDALLDYRSPEQVLSGQPQQVQGTACSLGVKRQIGEVEMLIGGLDEVSNDNDASCWLYLKYQVGEQRCSLLIAGDLSIRAERQLMRRMRREKLTWLHLSHHGSKTSTSDSWLEFWSPEWALNSRGRNNPFGHPHPSVLALLEARDIPLLDTAQVGEIYLTANAAGCTTQSFLERNRRYWH